jgi:hypothetical protein
MDMPLTRRFRLASEMATAGVRTVSEVAPQIEVANCRRLEITWPGTQLARERKWVYRTLAERIIAMT